MNTITQTRKANTEKKNSVRYSNKNKTYARLLKQWSQFLNREDAELIAREETKLLFM